MQIEEWNGFHKREGALAREAHKYMLQGLARRYIVSEQAMEIRLKELGLVCKKL